TLGKIGAMVHSHQRCSILEDGSHADRRFTPGEPLTAMALRPLALRNGDGDIIQEKLVVTEGDLERPEKRRFQVIPACWLGRHALLQCTVACTHCLRSSRRHRAPSRIS